ncbi:MAG: hypothetical protein PVH68_07735 [Armatimonadota bacterium]|jgi:hypothetical protein
MPNDDVVRPTHRGLRILLNALGVLCLLQVVAVFLPTAWLQATVDFSARLAGMEPFSPFWYGVRGLLLVFLGVAWMFFAAARDPERHRDFIHAVMLALAAWVILCPVFGHLAGVAFLWYAGDAVSALIVLVLLLVFYPRPAVQPATGG